MIKKIKNKHFVFLFFLKVWWWFILFFSLFILLFFLTYYKTNTNSLLMTVLVHRVVDGDTFIADNQKRYRIFGIDAPELSDKIRGVIAKNFLNKLINNQHIKIEKIAQDIYDRDVVKVFLKNNDIGLEMIKCGFAKVAYISLEQKNRFFSNDFVYYCQLIKTQHQAYKNDAGFWGRNQILWYD